MLWELGWWQEEPGFYVMKDLFLGGGTRQTKLVEEGRSIFFSWIHNMGDQI